jgi:predicted nucleotidyltransferase component of viral defense system
VAAPHRWVLKGGFALDLRLGAKARSTKDIDLARRDDADHATADLLAAQATNLEDYFVRSPRNSKHCSTQLLCQRNRCLYDSPRDHSR